MCILVVLSAMLSKLQDYRYLRTTLAICFIVLISFITISSYDPSEKLKIKSDDNLKVEAKKILNSIFLYYEKKGKFPWSLYTSSHSNSPGLPWSLLQAKELGICKDIECSIPGLVQEFTATIEGSIKFDINDKIYIGKGISSQDPLQVCFLPNSNKYRKNTAELSYLDLKSQRSAPSILESCPDRVTWQDEDVCYFCFSK